LLVIYHGDKIEKLKDDTFRQENIWKPFLNRIQTRMGKFDSLKKKLNISNERLSICGTEPIEKFHSMSINSTNMVGSPPEKWTPDLLRVG
jgi:hypothetical protein